MKFGSSLKVCKIPYYFFFSYINCLLKLVIFIIRTPKSVIPSQDYLSLIEKDVFLYFKDFLGWTSHGKLS